MALLRSLLRPGVFVALHTEVEGGVTRTKRDLDASDVQATAPAASTVRKTETTTIVDADYHAANNLRSEARSLISRVCVASKVGLLCPHGRVAELEQAIETARALVDEHNAKESSSKVGLYVACFETASNEEEVARAVASQMRGVLERMDQAIAKLDPDAIAAAATEARKLAATVAPEQAAKVQQAIDTARTARKDLIKQAGDSARRMAEGAAPIALILAEAQKTAQACARAAMVDFTEETPIEAGPAGNAARVAGLDVTEDAPPPDSSGAVLASSRVDLSDETAGETGAAPLPIVITRAAVDFGAAVGGE